MTIVQTTSGAARGQVHDGVAVHFGIPYASASGSGRRWRRRPETASSTPPRSARSRRQAGRAQFQRAELVQDEDCLFLNVYTARADAGRRPVMVWIHGGAFIIGSGDTLRRPPLVRRGDVVVVTLNYRLGMLGFLAPRPPRREPRGAGTTASSIRSRRSMGARQHRRLRRRPWQRHDLRRVGGRVGRLLLVPAARRPLPQGDRPERRRR